MRKEFYEHLSPINLVIVNHMETAISEKEALDILASYDLKKSHLASLCQELGIRVLSNYNKADLSKHVMDLVIGFRLRIKLFEDLTFNTRKLTDEEIQKLYF